MVCPRCLLLSSPAETYSQAEGDLCGDLAVAIQCLVTLASLLCCGRDGAWVEDSSCCHIPGDAGKSG